MGNQKKLLQPGAFADWEIALRPKGAADGSVVSEMGMFRQSSFRNAANSMAFIDLPVSQT
jgi:hypothetical protein